MPYLYFCSGLQYPEKVTVSHGSLVFSAELQRNATPFSAHQQGKQEISHLLSQIRPSPYQKTDVLSRNVFRVRTNTW